MTFAHFLGWAIAIGLVLLGLGATIVPGWPGTCIVFTGLFVGAWLDHFDRAGPPLLGALGLLSFTSYIIDAAATGVAGKTVNASRWAMTGALIGTVLGLFAGFIGLLWLPFTGAAIGEFLATRESRRAEGMGGASWMGLIFGMAARLALAFTMVGLFITAFLWKR